MSQSFKKWLIVTQYYPPEIGAPQIRLASLAHELKRNGMDVEVLTSLPNYPAGEVFREYQHGNHRREVLEGIPVRRTWIYAATGRSPVKRLANYLSFSFAALASAIAGPRPDVIFLESQPLSLGLVAVAMKWLRGVPYIYNVPDLQVDAARELHFIHSQTLLRLASATDTLFLRQSWNVSTVTQKFIEHLALRGLPRTKISFLPNGADAVFLRPRPADDELLNRWHLHGKKMFLYVGTHAFYHGLHTIIEAATLLRQREDLIFLFIGHGPERQRLIDMVEESGLTNVIFGESVYAERDRLYSITYASLTTLLDFEVAKQSRPSKIFPSLSCAVPVIYSGSGETAELIESNQVGLAVEPESPRLLAQAIADLADNETLRDQLGIAGRILVEREYNWSTIVTRWLEELHIEVDRKHE